jgi:hypothetical protein
VVATAVAAGTAVADDLHPLIRPDQRVNADCDMARPIKRRRGVPAGLLVTILGAWGALIPFIGPYFDYSIGFDDAWHWSANRLWLSILPGAVAVIGGLMMMFGATRRTVSTGALMALLSGMWFVVGPSVSMLWENGDLGTGAAFGDTGTRVLEWLGYHFGLGALIAALGAYELGFMAALPVADEVDGRPLAGRRERPPRRSRRRFLRRDRVEETPVESNGHRESPVRADAEPPR